MQGIFLDFLDKFLHLVALNIYDVPVAEFVGPLARGLHKITRMVVCVFWSDIGFLNPLFCDFKIFRF